MSNVRIPNGGSEPIQCYVVNVRGKPLTGLTDLYVKIRRASNGQFMDWADMTFKATGHIQLNKNLMEASATLAPGLYFASGGLNVGAMTNATLDDSYTIVPLQTPGTNAYLPAPGQIDVGGWADIADDVWDATLADHLDVGSTGEALNNLSMSTTGSKQITIQIRDTLATPLQGAQIDIYDATNTFFISRVITPITGNINAALDPGTYYLRIFKTGYAFTVPVVLVVTVDATVTYVGTSLIIVVPPSAPNLCAIYGTIRDAGGNPVSNAHVQFFAVTPQTVGTTIEGSPIVCAVTDANGYWRVELERKAEVSVVIEYTDINTFKTVPDAPSQEFTTWV